MAESWYHEGLCFECSRCGHCCKGAPGYVWVTWDESRRLARVLGLPVEAFRRQYLRRIKNRYSLIERANWDCVFWSDQSGCAVYEARPSQCRTYPFWPENLKSPGSWREVLGECPGAGHGRLYPAELIDRIRRGQEET